MSANVNTDYVDAHPDIGCKAATDYLREQSRCTSCPFSQCLDDLGRQERILLRRIPQIEKVYQLTDNGGGSPYRIAKKLHIPPTTVANWINGRQDIEPLVSQLGNMARYLSWPRDNVRV